ncbi:MAG: hypothetical protein V1819_01390 [bacterium]
MKKIFKIIVVSLLALGFIGFLAYGYFFKVNRDLSAQTFAPGEGDVICEEVIPIGNSLVAATELYDEVYQAYKNSAIKNASEQMNALVIALNNEGKVCDFDKCAPQADTGGPDATLEAKPLPGLPGKKLTYEVPTCQLKDATGNPCPDLTQFITPGKDTSLDDLAQKLKTQADNIHAIFETKTAIVPLGMEEENEVAGKTMISKKDLAMRYINAVETLLTPRPGSCAVTELERQRIDQNKMGPRYPEQCLEALAKDMYAPKAWSEACKEECATFTQECKDCLARCEGNSVYATLNCKIYSTGKQPEESSKCYQCKDNPTTNVPCDEKECLSGKYGDDCVFSVNGPSEVKSCHQDLTGSGKNDKCATIKGQSKQCCGAVCADGFNTACKECLCAGEDPKKPLSQEQCLDWICGGSSSNWVCCHEEPIENPAIYTDFTEDGAMGLTQGDSAQTTISSYTDDVNKTASTLPVKFGVMAATSKIPFGSCIKVNDVQAANNPLVMQFAKSYVLYPDTGQFFCVADRGGEFIESGQRLDLWLDKDDQDYQDRTTAGNQDFARQWGLRNSGIEYWYDPANPCIKTDKPFLGKRKKVLDLSACEAGPPNIDDVDSNGFKFAAGIDKQWKDVSGEMAEMLKCMKNKGARFVINSISDSTGMDFCSDPKSYSKPPCHHSSAYSCHYGGRKCKAGPIKDMFTDTKSYAVDIAFGKPDEASAAAAAKAACACAQDSGVAVTSVKEDGPLHYHISVKNQDCQCDVGLSASSAKKGYDMCQ